MPNRRTHPRAAARAAALAAALALPGAAGAPAARAQEGPPRVLATFAPLQAIAAETTAGISEPGVLAAPGASPHGIRLSPSAARAAAQADVIFAVGPGLEGPGLLLRLRVLAPEAAHLSGLRAPGVRHRPLAAHDDHGHGRRGHGRRDDHDDHDDHGDDHGDEHDEAHDDHEEHDDHDDEAYDAHDDAYEAHGGHGKHRAHGDRHGGHGKHGRHGRHDGHGKRGAYDHHDGHGRRWWRGGRKAHGHHGAHGRHGGHGKREAHKGHGRREAHGHHGRRDGRDGRGARLRAAAPDPHIWLSGHNAGAMARALAEELASRDPERAAAYRANAARFAAEAAEAEADWHARARALAGRPFMESHPVLGHMLPEEGGPRSIGSSRLDPDRPRGLRGARAALRRAEEEEAFCLFHEARDPGRGGPAARLEGARKVEVDAVGEGGTAPGAWAALHASLADAVEGCLSALPAPGGG